MKMLHLAFCVLSVLAFSGCTNTWEGLKKDAQDTKQWAHHQPSGLEQSIGPAPTGYAGQKEASFPASAELTGLYEIEPAESSVDQNTAKKLAPVTYEGGAVSVFPVDADSSPYEDKGYDYVRMGQENGAISSGTMETQLFFAYGSSRIGTHERRKLHQLAAQLHEQESAYKVNIVGHASKRVDYVTDPVSKKMINFEMALKRATAVTQALRHEGIRPDLLMATSIGDTMPNPNPGLKTQEASDRRVEVYVDRP